MSILERKFKDEPAIQPLYAHACYGPGTDLQRVTLTPQWFIIARESVIQSWALPGARPRVPVQTLA